MTHSTKFLGHIAEVALSLSASEIEEMVKALAVLKRRNGRLFILGLGGSAANASHAVNDFSKLCNILSYAPTDNVAELTARTNDEGWETVFSDGLKARRLGDTDAILVLSVGGGDEERCVSLPIIRAIVLAKEVGAKVLGIVGRDGGYTKQYADVCVLVPSLDPDLVTPITESFQAVVLHALVSHSMLSEHKAKWESLK